MAEPDKPEYYRPYLASDSELSDADSDTDTWTRTSTPRPENANPDYLDSRVPAAAPDFAALARALQSPPTDIGGPTFATAQQEDLYSSRRLDPHTYYYPYSRISSQIQYSPQTQAQIPDQRRPQAQVQMTSRPPGPTSNITTTASNETVIMLRSRDRDRNIYPQPTACQLFLPRIYRNVVAFSIAQINLISAFFYFSVAKQNIAIVIYEQNTRIYDTILYASLASVIPRAITNNIREGSYNITQLLNELQIQLNRVPLFYDFLNGFSDFQQLFTINGDYSINFNYPGDYYYDAVLQDYIPNPTRAQIVSYYFQSQFANQFLYTTGQVTIAYYYPVVKEALLDPTTNLTLYNFSGTGLSITDTINYLVYSFQGINDPIATIVINNNIPLLDEYRLLHTFRYSLVNQYACSYNPTNNRVTIQCPTLNNSLVNLLNAQYNSYLAQQLAKYNITAAVYNSLAITNTNLLSIIQAMYSYLQTNFAQYFAINYGTYSRTYYANTSNTVYIANGLDASGVILQYTQNLPPARNTDILADFRPTLPNLWPRMSNFASTEGAQRNMGSPADLYPQSSNFPYILTQSNINLTYNFIDLNGNIYTDPRRKAGDVMVDIDASKYTIFQFRSKFRQTLQVESLPRQTIWRYPAWNAACNAPYPINQLFRTGYSYLSPTPGDLAYITPFDISYNAIYGWSNLSNTTNNFGLSYNASKTLWGTDKEQINIANSNGRYYYFQTPLPINDTSQAYKYTFNVTIQSPDSSPFTSDLYAFFYQDIGAFSADIGNPRNELPIHYKEKLFLSSNSSSNIYSFNAYANQQYYVYVRPASITPPSTEYQIIPWFTSPTAYTTLDNSVAFSSSNDPTTMLQNFNVAQIADPDYLRMPISPSTLWNIEPPQVPINIPLPTKIIPMGYDTNEVSNDLTDYIPFSPYNFNSTINPAATVSVDPINNYIFQNNSGYNNITQTYFYPGTANAIIKPYAQSQYNPTAITTREYKMVNYYATTYIHDSITTTYQLPYPPTSITPYISSYTSATTSSIRISGYTYDSNDNLALGSGVCGFTFIPGDGTWAIDRITFKSNFINPLSSTNENVHALAIYLTGEISYQSIAHMELYNALAICLRVSETTYADSNSLNIGFDASLGTYYTFSNYPQLVTRTGTTISGFSQSSKTFIVDQNAYYSVVAYTFTDSAYSTWDSNAISTLLGRFTENNNTIPANDVYKIQNLTGSPIAYPYANTAYPSTVFYDGQASPAGNDVVLSTDSGNNTIYGPPVGADESICKYAQSIPYVNTSLHYLSPSYIVYDSNGFSPWTQLPITPTYIHASVPNHMLFQGTTFAFTTYKTYNTTVSITDPADRFFVYKEQLTPQQIYPDNENTALIAVSGNSKQYVFLGASNIPNSPKSQLRFKLYNPSIGVLTELPINPYYTFSNSLLLQNFVFHETQQWYLSATNVPNNNIYLQGDTSYSSNANSMLIYTYANNKASELQMDPKGSFLYLAYHNGQGFTRMNMFSLNPADSNYVRSNTTGYKIKLEAATAGLPPSYLQIAVTYNCNSGIEEVLLTNTSSSPCNYYYLNTYDLPSFGFDSNTNIIKSVQTFTDTPSRIIGGINGTKWTLFPNSPYVLGNRNDNYDAPTAINTAWQIFFPAVKIQMRQLTTGVTPIIDLTNITYPEWPHTAMFAYSNYQGLINDMSGNGGMNMGRWGQESNTNFMVCDASFNGFQFNSYLMNIPLLPNYSNGSYLTDYYLAVRGWLPTEKIQTMLRFYLPNRYDFGFARFVDISNEVLIASNDSDQFSPAYLQCLQAFNSNFTFSNLNFGSNSTQGFPGCNLNSSNFGDFINKYQGFCSTFSTNTYILSNIQSTVQASMNSFIITDMQYILPSTAVTRQRYTDPLLFQIQWKSQLAPSFVTLDDEWGLGWNLGYAKQDTGFATVQTAGSFYKITDDYIYLRMNPEFNINRMDAGGKENYSQSREPTGITNQYYCKLLLTNFGGNATTFIHNPVTLAPPIFRLTKLEFQWTDTTGAIIDNNDCEWDMVVNITESVDFVPIPRRTVPMHQALDYTPTVPPGQTVVYVQNLPSEETIIVDQSETIMDTPGQTTFNPRTSDYGPNLLRNPVSDLHAVGANYYNNQFSPLRDTTPWAKEMGSLFSTLG